MPLRTRCRGALLGIRAGIAAAWGLALLSTAAPHSARAADRDFVDETMVAEGMRPGETGFELGSDARVDQDDLLQGWFAAALERGFGSRLVVEAVGLGLSRGSGLELAGWRAESRYVFLEGHRAPVAAALALEWEVETPAAKHSLYERVLIPRLVLSRTFFGALLTTASGGLAKQLDPVQRSAFAWGAGARWPDRGPVSAGLEITREPLDDATRIVPQVALVLPGETRVRMGTAFGLRGVYSFIARIVIEKEIEL